MSRKDALRDLFVDHLIGMFQATPEGEAREVKAADLEVVRKVLTDPAFTFESVRKGDFGETAQRAAESFPFDDEGRALQ